MKRKILYVEDEPFLGRVVKETLEFRGYEVVLKNDGAAVMSAFDSFNPEVCVLDVMLPNVDGFSLCQKIRENYPKMPVIFLTAKGQMEDLTKGFELGGTDYIRKPFSVEELILRIENQLRLHHPVNKIQKDEQEIILLGKYEYNSSSYELSFGEKKYNLSYREAQVLGILIEHINEIIDRKKVLKSVWGDDSFFNSRNLDVYIKKLRQYFSDDAAIRIVTLKGKGYHFIVPIKAE